jgi:hypothetical protein
MARWQTQIIIIIIYGGIWKDLRKRIHLNHLFKNIWIIDTYYNFILVSLKKTFLLKTLANKKLCFLETYVVHAWILKMPAIENLWIQLIRICSQNRCRQTWPWAVTRAIGNTNIDQSWRAWFCGGASCMAYAIWSWFLIIFNKKEKLYTFCLPIRASQNIDYILREIILFKVMIRKLNKWWSVHKIIKKLPLSASSLLDLQ